jgi:hypothetical protein
MVPPPIDLSAFDLGYEDHCVYSDGSLGAECVYSGNEGSSFGSILSSIRSGLDNENYRIRNKIHEVRGRRRRGTDQQHKQVRERVEAERQSLIDRLLFLEDQVAANEEEAERLRDEMVLMRRRKSKAHRVVGSVASPIRVRAYK